MPARTPKTEEIVVQAIELRSLRVRIVGDSPLICHRFAEKARKKIGDRHGQKAQQKEAWNPEAEFNDARYRMADGRDGFPATGLKKAISNAFRFADGLKKVEINGALHVQPGQELVPIESDEPLMREDVTRASMTTFLRYRPEYRNWSIAFDIVYNERAISAEQVVNLLNIAGFGVGIGEWRPERNGQFGMFHVAEGEA